MLIKAYLKAINGLIGLTDKEIEVMFVVIQIVDSGKLDSISRDNIMGILDLTNQDLNNYISRLKKKGALVKKDNKVFVNQKLIPVLNESGISLQIDIYASR